MARKLRVAQYGCGKMSVYTMRYAMEKGAEIVCAFGRSPHSIGRDVGEIAGVGATGVLVQDSKDAVATLKEKKPDVCIIATASLMQDLKRPLMDCAESGVDAITTGEEAFYPWNSSSKTTELLDQVAKKNGCTLCGSGYQDVFWGNLITTLAGATHTIKKITGKSSYNVEDYGMALAKAHGAGLSLADFDKEIAAADDISDAARQALIAQETFLPSYMWSANGWLCGKLGLEVKGQTQKCVPQTHNAELRSETLQMTIPAGHATGMSARVTTVTEEGIVIEAECIGNVYAAGELDQNVWSIHGEPYTEVIINRPATVELTCATIVNRIPDVIAAAPGFTTTDRMPTNAFRAKDLGFYLREPGAAS
jgi:4-hydroxy-tetrahydrodipicolinate reductase